MVMDDLNLSPTKAAEFIVGQISQGNYRPPKTIREARHLVTAAIGDPHEVGRYWHKSVADEIIHQRSEVRHG